MPETIKDDPTLATLKETKDFFEMSAKEFLPEWKELSDAAKLQIRKGLKDGSLNY